MNSSTQEALPEGSRAWYLEQIAQETALKDRCEPGFDKVYAQWKRGLCTCDELLDQLARIRYVSR